MTSLHDLTQLSSISDESITALLRERFNNDLFCAKLSSTATVIVNAFQDLSQEPIARTYNPEELPAVSDAVLQAYEHLRRDQESQSVLFIGESGSGKSAYRKHSVGALIDATATESTLAERIKHAQTILDGFGSAKQVSSVDASRFGLSLELQFNNKTRMVGCKWMDFRLKKDLVSHVPTGERNFHVFYGLLAGMSHSELAHLGLDSTGWYRYLGHASAKQVSGIDDFQSFAALRQSLHRVGVSRLDIACIFQTLAAILHLGQLEFVDSKHQEAAYVKDTKPLDLAAAFLGVTPDVLENALVYKTKTIRREHISVMLPARGCQEHCDELASVLYSLLFAWLVETLNDKLCVHESQVANFIALVDFPGFAARGSDSVAGFDQLLFNTANEQIQRLVVQTFFHDKKQFYDTQEIEVADIKFDDNEAVVTALTKPSNGLLAILDDQSSKLSRGKTETTFVEALGKRFSEDIIAINLPSAGNFNRRLGFTVAHYAGQVDYDVAGFLDLNQEVISADLVAIFAGVGQEAAHTSSTFILRLFQSTVSGAPKVATEGRVAMQPARRPTMKRRVRPEHDSGTGAADQFRQGLQRLTESLLQTRRHFVFCVKPNDRRLANQFDSKCVAHQLASLQLSRIVDRIRSADHSNVLSFSMFLSRYVKQEDLPVAGTHESQCQLVLRDWGFFQRDAMVGTTHVLLSEKTWYTLEQRRDLGGVYNMAGASRSNLLLTGSRENLLEAASEYGQQDIFANMQSKDALEQQAKMANAGQAVEEISVSGSRKRWLFIVYFLTWWLPDFVIKAFGSKRKDIRIAWREKLAINILIWMACAIAVFFIAFLGEILCPRQAVYSFSELAAHGPQEKQPLTAIRGEVFDVGSFAPRHYPPIVPTKSVLKYAGHDASALFPVQISALCQGTEGTVDPAVTISSNYTDINAGYHDFRYFTNDYRKDWYFQQMMMLRSNYRVGYIGYTTKDITVLALKQQSIAIINGQVFNLTDYIQGGRQILGGGGGKVSTDFMDPSLVSLFQQQSGKDISKSFSALPSQSKQYMEVCLRNLFFCGRVDTRNGPRCLTSRYILLAISIMLVSLIGVKFLAALQFSTKRLPEKLDKFLICQIPVYTEDEESVQSTIDSIARMNYNDQRKLMFIICDGMVTGKDCDRSTPQIVLDTLGVLDTDAVELPFESLGEGTGRLNYAKVYSGLYETTGHVVPFIVVVKVGKPSETLKAGNRGKRDSQLIMMRFLNRVANGSPMTPLELELYHQIQNVIGVSPSMYEFCLMVDADTTVEKDAATRMIASCLDDTRIIGICGETHLANAKSSMVTMIQVYEYFISHNLAKAFESLFRSVTCLPGCFTMYRLRDEASRRPLFVSDRIIEEYSQNRVDTLHTKNLLHLGEDRYLTTLLLKHHPKYSTIFIRDAKAATVAPESLSVLLSQRRRWINSTIHNLVELVAQGSGLCGFACFGMRFIVFMDLASTVVQPVTVGYIAYLFYLTAKDSALIPITSLILFAAIYGLQAVIFIIRRKWDMIIWMIIYLLALPIFSLALPLYAFWSMDTFTWGSTRIVDGENGKAVLVTNEGVFDESMVPLSPWTEEYANWSPPAEKQVDAASMTSRGSYNTRYEASGLLNRYSLAAAHSPRQTRPAYSKTDLHGDAVEMDELALQRPTRDELTASIRELCATEVTPTRRLIREKLEMQYGCDLEFEKDWINQTSASVFQGLR
ncbi:chitin synthase-domain-containing protein [Protomyces lactucae-debilis]|uniref:chitin synthase n=1 Tax=Protomyces lactucae-debilis TaxID=2754530 RepID=A0A1Y2EYD0_PROLT|nr:chitin synthase-domain-containing protein [Protomyces lactucae-debilis]ORY75795.1 chitin synthase-domain-containing protein [Protomyces lactucae-debilis]